MNVIEDKEEDNTTCCNCGGKKEPEMVIADSPWCFECALERELEFYIPTNKE